MLGQKGNIGLSVEKEEENDGEEVKQIKPDGTETGERNTETGED